MPQEYWLGDKALYIGRREGQPARSTRATASSAPTSQKRSLDFLQQFDKEIAAAKIDTAKTWDDRFVKKATETVR